MIVIGVDPGKTGLALAVLDNGRLREHAAIKATKAPLLEIRARLLALRLPPARLLVVERMQARGRYAADLIELSLVGGVAIGVFPAQEIETPLACQWKGSVPKHAHQKLLRERFVVDGVCAQEELDQIKNHNVIDAIGIAFYGHTRLTLRDKIDRM